MRWDRCPTRWSRSESPKPEARRADNRGDHVRRYRDVRRACLASRLTGVYERSRRPRGVSGRQGQVRRRSRWCADGVRSRRHLAVRVAATLVDRHARSRPRCDLRRRACLVSSPLNSHADSEGARGLGVGRRNALPGRRPRRVLTPTPDGSCDGARHRKGSRWFGFSPLRRAVGPPL